jgi:hypothetical protein
MTGRGIAAVLEVAVYAALMTPPALVFIVARIAMTIYDAATAESSV